MFAESHTKCFLTEKKLDQLNFAMIDTIQHIRVSKITQPSYFSTTTCIKLVFLYCDIHEKISLGYISLMRTGAILLSEKSNGSC